MATLPKTTIKPKSQSQHKHRLFTLQRPQQQKKTKVQPIKICMEMKPLLSQENKVHKRYRSQIKVNFQVQQNGKPQASYPIFNKDKLYYTQSFNTKTIFDPSNDSIFIQNRKKYFDSRISQENKNYDQEKTQQIKWKQPESTFCLICVQYFENYLKHVKSKKHLQNKKKPSIVDLWMKQLLEMPNSKIHENQKDTKQEFNLKKTLVDESQCSFPYKKIKQQARGIKKQTKKSQPRTKIKMECKDSVINLLKKNQPRNKIDVLISRKCKKRDKDEKNNHQSAVNCMIEK